MVETWLTNNIDNDELHINDYVLHRRDRGTRGGGLLVHCHNNIKSKRLYNLEINQGILMK